MNTGRIAAATLASLATLALCTHLVLESRRQDEERRLSAEASRVQTVRALVNWSTHTAGWEAPMTPRAELAGIGGFGVKASSDNNRLRVAFQRIVIEKNPAAPDVQVIGLAATYSRTDGGGRRGAPTSVTGGASSQRFEALLTSEAPVLVIEGREFEFASSNGCPRPGCRYGLEVSARPARRP